MFYLSKICRICVKNSENLLDVDSEDFDLIKLSEKLQVCTKMVIDKEDLSTSICMSCIKKLRISYLFQKMCIQSDGILQNYLSELMSVQETEEGNNNNESSKFVNSELRVTLRPLPSMTLDSYHIPKVPNAKPRLKVKSIETLKHLRFRPKRVSKGQRCSLLKKLLSNYHQSNSSREISKRIRRRTRNTHNRFRGGLRDLLGFIKTYDFGYKIKEPVRCKDDDTALGKLEQFSKTFFYTDFTNYHNTILSVIQDTESSDEDDMFNDYNEEEDQKLWFHSTIKDINDEIILKEEPADIKVENDYEEEDIIPFEFVQACYDHEPPPNISSNTSKVDQVKLKNGKRQHANFILPDISEPSNIKLLEQFAANKTNNVVGARTMSPFSLKCRTRGHPFINPKLMEQFKKRSFKCDTCNRSFKSPGYLHSHCTKMGH